MAINIFSAKNALDTHIIHALEALSYSGGNMAIAHTTENRMYTILRGTTVGCTANFEISVPSGTYYIYLNTPRGPSRGQISVYIDGVGQGGGFDCYKSSIEYNAWIQAQGMGMITDPVVLNLRPGRHILTLLCNSKNDLSSGYAMTINVIKLVRTGYDKRGMLYLNNLRKTWSMFPIEFYGSGGSGWTITPASTRAFYCGVSPATTGQVGDYLQKEFEISPGNYQLKIIYSKGTSFGIVTISIDGVTIGTFDSYASDVTYNVLYTTTDIIKLGGQHTIKLETTGKHASSSSYKTEYCFLQIVPSTEAATITICKSLLANKISTIPKLILLNYADSNVTRVFANGINKFLYYCSETLMDENDYVEAKFFSGAGTFDITFYYRYDASYIATYDVTIDGVAVGTITITSALLTTLSNIVITKGLHTMRIISNESAKYECLNSVFLNRST